MQDQTKGEHQKQAIDHLGSQAKMKPDFAETWPMPGHFYRESIVDIISILNKFLGLVLRSINLMISHCLIIVFYCFQMQPNFKESISK